jgi:hypothetical protein
MLDEAAALPDDAVSLRALVRALFAERNLAFEALKLKTLELEKMKAQLAKLRRLQFGRSSEKLSREIAQLELAIEEIETNQEPIAPQQAVIEVVATGAADAEAGETPEAPPARSKPARRPLPNHLPRETVVHAPPAACPDCGGITRALAEDKSQVLEYVPGHFRIVEHCGATNRVRIQRQSG